MSFGACRLNVCFIILVYSLNYQCPKGPLSCRNIPPKHKIVAWPFSSTHDLPVAAFISADMPLGQEVCLGWPTFRFLCESCAKPHLVTFFLIGPRSVFPRDLVASLFCGLFLPHFPFVIWSLVHRSYYCHGNSFWLMRLMKMAFKHACRTSSRLFPCAPPPQPHPHPHSNLFKSRWTAIFSCPLLS